MRIKEYEHATTPDFERYEAIYHADVLGYEAVATLRELMEAIREADVILVGDYHTLHIAQKTYLKLIKRIRSRQTTLALEFFPTDGQPAIDAWLSGRIKERTLLRRTNYKTRWPYDIWPDIKPIAETARRRGWALLGIDGAREAHRPLTEADDWMAEVIVNHLSEAPVKTRVMTLVGELHLATGHLPAALKRTARKTLGRELRVLSVLQNNETLYWQLMSEPQHQDREIVRVDRDTFCILNTPPVVVQQSYLNWIEYEVDTLGHEHLQRNFRELASSVARALGVRMPPAFSEFSVHGPDDQDVIEDLEAQGLLVDVEEVLEGSTKPAYIVLEDRLVYFANLSMNIVGETAARLLHGLEAQHEPDSVHDFYGQVLCDALAFFGSKVVNPRRKGKHAAHYRAVLRSVGTDVQQPKEHLEIASAILLHKAFETGTKLGAYPSLEKLEPYVRRQVARRLGNMLGERLYYAYDRGLLHRQELRRILRFELSDSAANAALYFSVERRVGRVSVPRRL